MTPWGSTRPADVAFKNWMEAHGISRAEYLALDRYEQADLRVESKGGLSEVSFFKEWGSAAADVATGYGQSAARAARGVASAAVKTLTLFGVVAGLVVLIVYRRPLLKLAGKKNQ